MHAIDPSNLYHIINKHQFGHYPPKKNMFFFFSLSGVLLILPLYLLLGTVVLYVTETNK